jgi:hypothetical protein
VPRLMRFCGSVTWFFVVLGRFVGRKKKLQTFLSDDGLCGKVLKLAREKGRGGATGEPVKPAAGGSTTMVRRVDGQRVG